MLELFVATLAAIFSVVNPMGAIPVFLALTPDYNEHERNVSARNSSIYFTLISLAFFLAGTAILSFFGISINAVRIAGGLVILLSGYNLLAGKFAESRAVNQTVREEALEKEDISFSPMAMPLLSGPGSISLLITLYNEYEAWDQRGIIMVVILVMGLLIFLILRSAKYFFRVLGVGGLKALSRIMGFLVMCIGVQYMISGVTLLVKNTLN